jgi:hypothetical protein
VGVSYATDKPFKIDEFHYGIEEVLDNAENRSVEQAVKSAMAADMHMRDRSTGDRMSLSTEIEMVEESLFKISKLLMLCYGEAGATVVSKMIKSESAFIEFNQEKGNKVLAIFAFCDIRNFTDATEVFQSDVISLVNHVASIVH